VKLPDKLLFRYGQFPRIDKRLDAARLKNPGKEADIFLVFASGVVFQKGGTFTVRKNLYAVFILDLPQYVFEFTHWIVSFCLAGDFSNISGSIFRQGKYGGMR
jgi:hypothetical protein